MARRSKSWDENLSKKLQDPDFAKYFFLSLIEDEELSLKDALRELVQSYGISEYASLCGIAQPNLSRALDPSSNPTLTTIEKILSPLSLSLAAKESIKATGAA